jgi:N-acetylmuramoyl-L-alanine amidase
MKTVIVDPGHGMDNRKRGVYDPGVCAAHHSEAVIAMDWANELRGILKARGCKVVRTRVGDKDPAPVSRRDDIARAYGGDIMISLHCNAANGRASGTETFYRGADDYAMAKRLTDALCAVMATPNRGPKTEHESQHASLAVMEFDKCFLIEIGFIDNPSDRAKMLDPGMRRNACEAIASVII